MTSRELFIAERLFESGSGAGAVLGLDTSVTSAALAIVSDGRVLAEQSRPARSHGARLPDMIEELLDAANLGLSDLGGIAIGIGPGSFTGLRVGMAYVKGLALALGLPVVGVPSLDAIGLGAAGLCRPQAGTLICPVMDARKGEIYAALYRVMPDALEKVSEDLVVVPGHFFPHIDGEVMLVGDAKVQDVAGMLSARGVRISTVALDEVDGRGRCVAALGAARLAAGESDPLPTLEPLYVRPIEATFRSAAAGSPGIGGEGLWNSEKKRSFSNSQSTTRN